MGCAFCRHRGKYTGKLVVVHQGPAVLHPLPAVPVIVILIGVPSGPLALMAANTFFSSAKLVSTSMRDAEDCRVL